MNLKVLLKEQIEREYTYLMEQGVGTQEYNDSMERLNNLESKMAELEHYDLDAARRDKQFEEERKARKHNLYLEIVKIGTGVGLPLIGLVAITAFEKEDTFTSALKGYVNCFIPKKIF